MFIKVPATPEGVEAFRELTAAGVSVNVTLLFAVERYEEIANAWIDGLERRVAGRRAGRPARLGRELLRLARGHARSTRGSRSSAAATSQGIAAVANAKLAYRSFQRIFSGPRWEALAAKGAHVQRPLWASTSTKNPSYPDTLYVDTLIGPAHGQHDARGHDRRHARPRRRRGHDRQEGRRRRGAHGGARRASASTSTQILVHELVDEGVESFTKSFDSLIATIDDKARALAPARA